MRACVVLTIIGPDRPGIVEQLATLIASHGGNWEQSRMAHLAGQFAGILRVTLPHDNVRQLEHALETLGDTGLRVFGLAGAEREREPLRAYRLSVIGDDREGIVRDLARVLSQRDVNVEELDTHCESAPMSGELLFRARALLHVPATLDISELRQTLEALADDLMVELDLGPEAKP